jgi:peroxiredoxin Q/BCP
MSGGIDMVDVGQVAPDFTLPASNGKEVSLSDFRGKQVVLYFYPRDLTPGCTEQACNFRDEYEQFSDLNAVILGVSRDPLSKHEKFISKHGLPFLLLSDEDAKVCQQYGVFKEKTMFGKKSMGIERTTFVIDSEGIIRKVYRKVKVKGHVSEV